VHIKECSNRDLHFRSPSEYQRGLLSLLLVHDTKDIILIFLDAFISKQALEEGIKKHGEHVVLVLEQIFVPE
jgi:hypothetical protein